MKRIIMEPIGVVHSPYKSAKNIPIQGVFKKDAEAVAVLDEAYAGGLKGLEDFSHAILIYHFHRSRKHHVEGRPFLEENKHGIFAIRSPHRPNHIGLSIVGIVKIEGNKLYFTEVDILDGTPLLDIKPYVKYFDFRADSTSGWIDKHFKEGTIPDKTILK